MNDKTERRLKVPSSLPVGFDEFCRQSSRLAALGMVSSYLMHDIRNKLAVISGHTQIIQLKGEKLTLEDLSRRLALIMDSIGKILDSFDNVGSFAQRAAGVKSDITPEKSLEFVLSSQRRRLEDAGIRITDNTSDSGRTFSVDPSLLDYVFLKMIETFLPQERYKGELLLSSTGMKNAWKLNMYLIDEEDGKGLYSGFLNRAGDFGLVAALLAVETMQGELVLRTGPEDYGFRLTIPWGE